MRKLIMPLLAAAALLVPAAGVAQRGKAKEEEKPTRGKILLVVTNHGQLGDTGKPTGYWLAEVSHAWTRFVDAGYQVDFASPKGETAPADPRSFTLDDPENARLWSKREHINALAQTIPAAKVNPGDYKAVYFAGGHGTMWDFPDNADLQKITREIYEKGGVVSAVCHGPAALVNAKTADGKYLVDGKHVAAFTNGEEKAGGLEKVVPFLLEDKLNERGATVETAPNYEKKVVTDGRLITGQNPASAAGVAEEVIKALDKK